MRQRNKIYFIAVLLFCTPILGYCRGSDMEGINILLPEQVGDWKKHEKALTYEGDDLFLYINGGAEIYQEFGFDKVIVQDYKNETSGTISIEIYKMDSSLSAYGIFTFKSGSAGRSLDFGQEVLLEDYYLNMRKGPYLITLTGFDESESTIQGLQNLGREIYRRITETGGIPDVVRLLPEKELISQSVKFFKGPLALYNSHRFVPEDVFRLKVGARGDYTDGSSLFIFEYQDPDKAQEVFQKAQDFFASNVDFRVGTDAGERYFFVQDPKDSFFTVRRISGYILILKNQDSYNLESFLFLEAEERINR